MNTRWENLCLCCLSPSLPPRLSPAAEKFLEVVPERFLDVLNQLTTQLVVRVPQLLHTAPQLGLGHIDSIRIGRGRGVGGRRGGATPRALPPRLHIEALVGGMARVPAVLCVVLEAQTDLGRERRGEGRAVGWRVGVWCVVRG